MRLKALTMIVAASGVFLGAVGCGRGDGAETAPEPGDEVVARVAGAPVWTSDVEREAAAQGLISEGEPLEPGTAEFRRVLDEVVDQALLAREAERQKLGEDPAVRRRLQAARDQVLGDVLVERAVDGAVTEDEVRRLYREFRSGERATETLALRQIVVATEAEAGAVRRDLEGGAAFDALALDRSTDEETRFKGGELGDIDPGLLPEPLARAVADARAGALVGPVAIDGGWAVFRVDERRAQPVRSLEEMRPQIVRFLSFDEIRKLLQRLRADTNVEVMTPPAEGAAPASEPATASRQPSAASPSRNR